MGTPALPVPQTQTVLDGHGNPVEFPVGMPDEQISKILAADYAKTSVPAAPSQPEGFWHSIGAQFGLTPEQLQAESNESLGQRIKDAALGPAGQIVKGIYQQGKESVSQVMQARAASVGGNRAEGLQHLVQAIPIVGPALVKAGENTPGDARESYGKGIVAAATDPGTLGTNLGAAIQAAPLAEGGIRAAGGGAALDATGNAIRSPINAATDAVSEAATATKSYLRPKSSPTIVAPEEIQAQKIAQSILPPGGIKPEFVKSIQAEAPAVVEYAQRTGNPLNTQAEGLKAAQGVAQEGLQHFNTQILAPVANDTVSLGVGKTYLGSSATLGNISDEISSLNKKVNTAKASNSGDALMMLEKSGIQDQLQYLRSTLYDQLARKTGLSPEQLQTLREGYGGQFSLADSLESAQNARLTRTGQSSQGQQTIAGKVPTSVADIPMKAVNAARGGEQAISDRQFSSAMSNVQPVAAERPIPTFPQTAPSVRPSPISGPSTPVPTFDFTPMESTTEANVAARNAAKQEATASNRSAAQQEFLHSHTLTQAAQDASTQRGAIADAARDQYVLGNGGPAAWAQQGYSKVLTHIAKDSSGGLSAGDIVNLGKTPKGAQLLIKASDLQPGSAAMKNLIQQIKTTLGATQ